MSYPYRNYMDGSNRSPRLDYLTASYGGRVGLATLNALDRISSLREDYMPARGPYVGGADPYVRAYAPPVDNFVSAARSAAASSSQPVYATRPGYAGFDHFEEEARRPGPRRDNRPKPVVQQRKPVLRSSNNKDLNDTAPKKVLKRPAAKAPNEQSLTEHLKLIGSDEPVIGLKHVTENVTEFCDSDRKVYSYTCGMCTITGKAEAMAEHITSKTHRKNYIKEHKLEEVADKDLAKRAAAIETVHGRGEWSVSKKTEGLKLYDKSKFFKKVKKAGDVDMTDLTGGESASGNGLRDGEVVVEELLISDDEANEADPRAAQLFVLKSLDTILNDKFTIENEEEAMIVDSIIRKMDRSLCQFVELMKAETGVDDIQLLDKDEEAAKAMGEVMAETPAVAVSAPAAAVALAPAIANAAAAVAGVDPLVAAAVAAPAVANSQPAVEQNAPVADIA